MCFEQRSEQRPIERRRQADGDIETMKPAPPQPLDQDAPDRPTDDSTPSLPPPSDAMSADPQKQPTDTKGIEETTDLIEVIETLAVEIIERAADGVQPSDAVTLALDGEVREDLIAAAEGIQKVPGELGDLSAEEAGTLAQRGLEIPFAVFDELKS